MWYLFTLIFTSSVLFSRLKKANRLQRIYLVLYKLFVVVIIVIVIVISSIIIIITICEFGVLYGTFCLIKCYILELDTACENKSDQWKIPMEYYKLLPWLLIKNVRMLSWAVIQLSRVFKCIIILTIFPDDVVLNKALTCSTGSFRNSIGISSHHYNFSKEMCVLSSLIKLRGKS